MKTSVIEVHEMLSVLSVDEVEKRIGEVPGVESVTVNFAAGSATVRYDETRLEPADIKSAVRQRGYEPTAAGKDHDEHPASADSSKGSSATGHDSHKTNPVSAANPASVSTPPDKAEQSESSASTTPKSAPTPTSAPSLKSAPPMDAGMQHKD